MALSRGSRGIVQLLLASCSKYATMVKIFSSWWFILLVDVPCWKFLSCIACISFGLSVLCITLFFLYRFSNYEAFFLARVGNLRLLRVCWNAQASLHLTLELGRAFHCLMAYLDQSHCMLGLGLNPDQMERTCIPSAFFVGHWFYWTLHIIYDPWLSNCLWFWLQECTERIRCKELSQSSWFHGKLYMEVSQIVSWLFPKYLTYKHGCYLGSDSDGIVLCYIHAQTMQS